MQVSCITACFRVIHGCVMHNALGGKQLFVYIIEIPDGNLNLTRCRLLYKCTFRGSLKVSLFVDCRHLYNIADELL